MPSLGRAEQLQLKLNDPELLLLFKLLGVGFLGSGLYWFGLLGTGAGIYIARLDVDVGLLPQFSEVGA